MAKVTTAAATASTMAQRKSATVKFENAGSVNGLSA
jgi:hypothetical protein